MILPDPDLQAWIDALRTDPAATATAVPSSPYSAQQRPATWRLGMFASAYFYVITPDDVRRLVALIPQLHAEFQQLTGNALTRYLSFGTANIARKPLEQRAIEKRYCENADRIESLVAFDAPSKESSSVFAFQSITQFQNASSPGKLFRPSVDTPITAREIVAEECTYGLDYLSVNFPLSFWRRHKTALRRWWLSALQRLKPVQAYMGLGMGLPPILERYPFQQSAEFALAERFLGLDVDKPFFMRSNWPDGLHLEHGMRTPSFGVLVAGDYLQRLGGEAALRAQLASLPADQLHPCLDGLWIEAEREPALHPVEHGVPPALRTLAQALKPLRLSRLWMVSYPPNLARQDIFTPESSARWLRRFDADSDWGGLIDGQAPQLAAAQAQQPHVSGRLTARPGEPCPRTGYWRAKELAGRSILVQQGDLMPGPQLGRPGSVVWVFEREA